jgi:type IV secretory pathway VirB4 component
MLRAQPPTRRAPYRSTTRHAQALYPFVTDATLGTRGVLIGHDGLGRPFVFDPFTLYERRLLSGPNMLVLGDIGYGKSSLVKLYLFRALVFGRVPLIIDAKGEYDRLCEAVGVTPIRLVAKGPLRLNPLDPAVAGDDRLPLLRSITELVCARPLQPREDAALEQAWTRAQQHAGPTRQPVIADVSSALLAPDKDAAEVLKTTAGELADWGRDTALALRRLAGAGDLAGLFDQPTSAGLDLSGEQMVAVNIAGVADHAKPILMACVAAWLKRLWARQDGRRRIVVQEEAWHLLAAPSVAAMAQANFKLARQYGVQNIIVLHHLSDLRAAGDQGSRTAELATGLLADAATRVLHHLDEGQVRASAELLGLNQAHRHLIPHLGRGSALWLVGDRAHIVHHRLTEIERWIIDTDHAMLGGPPHQHGHSDQEAPEQ